MTISLDANWGASPRADRVILWTVAGVLAVWLAAVAMLGAQGVFLAAPSRPPLAVLIAIVAPIVAFTASYHASRRFRAFVLAIDLRLLTAFQAWRVIGSMFLVFYAYGMLSGVFAFPAGIGDAAVGLAAPFVVWAIMREAPGWRRRVFWLNVGGLVDFAVAIATGVMTSSSAVGFFYDPAAGASMGEMPLSLVPTFAVPLWTICHIIALVQLRRRA